MCREAREYLAAIDNLDGEEARKWMERLAHEKPFILAECKGMSIARAVLVQLGEGTVPRPPILSTEVGEVSAWYITKGFLDRIGVASVEQVPESVALAQIGASVEPEEITSPRQLLDHEKAFPYSDLTLPAIRFHMAPAEVALEATSAVLA